MRSILALDLATRIGFAIFREGDDGPIFGIYPLPKTDNIGVYLYDARKWLRAMMVEYQTTHVVYEAPMVRHGNRRDPRKDDENVIQRLFGLAGEAAVAAVEADAYHESVKHGTMMVHWVGSQYLTSEDGKVASMTAAKIRGWECEYDDEADALGLLTFFMAKQRYPAPWDLRACPSVQYLTMAAKGKIRA